VQKNNLTTGLLLALLLASPLVGAGPYPPPFEPSIIYQDPEAVPKSTQPTSSETTKEAKPAAAGTKYPAGFEPTVVYRDAELIAKHGESKPATTSTGQTAPEAEQTAVSKPAEASKSQNPLIENYPIALVALALAALAFWSSRRSASKAQQTVTTATGLFTGTPGKTGVARYLSEKPEPAAETGVSKYLKGMPAPTPDTGVSKYLKSMPAAVKAAETGVSKYLKNRT